MSESTANTSMLNVPDRSSRTTDRVYSYEELRSEIDRLIMARAEYIAAIVLPLQQRFGKEVMQIAGEAIYQIGLKKGAQIAAKVEEKSLQNLYAHFATEIDTIYWGLDADQITDDVLVVHCRHCPLPRRWKQMGLADEQIIELCSLFDNVDKGIAAGYREDLQAQNSGVRSLAGEGFCTLTITATT